MKTNKELRKVVKKMDEKIDHVKKEFEKVRSLIKLDPTNAEQQIYMQILINALSNLQLTAIWAFQHNQISDEKWAYYANLGQSLNDLDFLVEYELGREIANDLNRGDSTRTIN
jgi:hypothetical protein